MTAQRSVKIPHPMQKKKGVFPLSSPHLSCALLVSIYIVIICMLSDRLAPSSSPLLSLTAPASQLAFPFPVVSFLCFLGIVAHSASPTSSQWHQETVQEELRPKGWRQDAQEMWHFYTAAKKRKEPPRHRAWNRTREDVIHETVFDKHLFVNVRRVNVSIIQQQSGTVLDQIWLM